MKSFKASILLTFALLLIITSCNNTRTEWTTDPVIDSLVGSWMLPAHSEDNRSFIEEWIRMDDSTFAGIAYVVNLNTDDHFNQEEMRLEYRSGQWSYVAEPKGQPGASFALSEISENHFRAENPEHDFPKYIQYKWESADSIVAEIGDSASKRQFIMVRMK